MVDGAGDDFDIADCLVAGKAVGKAWCCLLAVLLEVSGQPLEVAVASATMADRSSSVEDALAAASLAAASRVVWCCPSPSPRSVSTDQPGTTACRPWQGNQSPACVSAASRCCSLLASLAAVQAVL